MQNDVTARLMHKKQQKDYYKLANLNAQCLTNKIEHLQQILHDSKLEVLCISEHWYSEANYNTIFVPGYKVPSIYCRSEYIHGGVLILTKEHLGTKILDLTTYTSEKHLEACGIAIPQIHAIVIVVYRSPNGNEEQFIESFNDMVENIRNEFKKENIFIAGDYNVDVSEHTSFANNMHMTLFENGLKPVFNSPSRILGNRCVDNIFVDKYFTYKETEVVNWHMGDHLCQIVHFEVKPEKKLQEMIKIRKHTTDNIETFKQLLSCHDWSAIYNEEVDAMESYRIFHDSLQDCYNKAFPQIIVKKGKSMEEIKWVTPEIQKVKNKLDACYTIMEVTKNTQYLDDYKKLKQSFQNELNRAKKEAYGNFIKNSDNVISASWKVVKIETGKIKQNGNFNSDLSADEFNNFFIKAGQLSGRKSETNPIELLQPRSIDAANFRLTNEKEVLNAIQNLKTKKTRDVFDMSTALFKEIKCILVKHLVHLINKCLLNGSFPDELKMAKITPLFKKGDCNTSNNYRPISILPTISKIFETIIKSRLLEHLMNNKILSDKQHGYLQKRSTITAISQVISKILEGFDKQEYIQMACCDLSKAFDSINHLLLKKKLEHYGVQGKESDLLTSYLKNRKQMVEWNGEKSAWRLIEQGVPQGSVLGPILFVLYINDLPESTSSQSVCLFADDTSFINCGKDYEMLTETTHYVLEEAKKWFDANELQMNKEKTNILTFFTKQNNFIQNKMIKFLGVTISETLTWSFHIELLKKRLTSALYCLRVVARNLSKEMALTVYYAYFHSLATYAIQIWGLASEMASIFLLQKKAVRIICKLGPRDSCRQYFKELKMLTIPSAYILTLLTYAHAHRDIFNKNSHNHMYDTRQSDQLAIPYHRVKKSQHGINYVSIKLYNKLPPHIKGLEDQPFKNVVKQLLIEGGYYTLDEFLSQI